MHYRLYCRRGRENSTCYIDFIIKGIMFIGNGNKWNDMIWELDAALSVLTNLTVTQWWEISDEGCRYVFFFWGGGDWISAFRIWIIKDIVLSRNWNLQVHSKNFGFYILNIVQKIRKNNIPKHDFLTAAAYSISPLYLCIFQYKLKLVIINSLIFRII